MDIQKVQQIREHGTVTHMANAPEFIKRVVNLRGLIVPIIDMRIQLNRATPSYDPFTVVIILTMGNRVICIVIAIV